MKGSVPGITQAQAAVGQISYSNAEELRKEAHLGAWAILAGRRES